MNCDCCTKQMKCAPNFDYNTKLCVIVYHVYIITYCLMVFLELDVNGWWNMTRIGKGMIGLCFPSKLFLTWGGCGSLSHFASLSNNRLFIVLISIQNLSYKDIVNYNIIQRHCKRR